MRTRSISSLAFSRKSEIPQELLNRSAAFFSEDGHGQDASGFEHLHLFPKLRAALNCP
jgi:hypothetical protein